MPGMFLAQKRQTGLDEIHLGEEVRFELVADEIQRCRAGGEFFDGTNNSYILVGICS